MLRYKATAGLQWISLSEGTSTSALLYNLASGFQYDFSVQATNLVGAGAWSNVVTVTTPITSDSGVFMFVIDFLYSHSLLAGTLM